MDSLFPETDSASRILVARELSQGLSGLKADLQETLRNTLREEVPRALAHVISEGHSFIVAPRTVTAYDEVKEISRHTSPLNHGGGGNKTVSDAFDGVLPGSVSVTTPHSSYQTSKMFQPVEGEEACTCGNIFLGDAVFCRKCGKARPGACSCGNIMQKDATFCRKCGKHRELTITVPANSSNQDGEHTPNAKGTTPVAVNTPTTVTSNMTRGTKRHKKKMGALFKEKGDVPPLSLLQRFTTHRLYEGFSGVLIVLNGIFLGLQAQYMSVTALDKANLHQPLETEPGIFFVVHSIFCFLFSVDLVLRWAADGFVEFFKGESISWNIMDVVIVVSSVAELCIEVIFTLSETDKQDLFKNVSVIRMLRVLRIVRIARVIRVMRFFRELRMMIYSILGSLKNLIWVMVVLFMTFYMFGVTFSSATRDFMTEAHQYHHPDNEALVESFGTVDRSILTLFKSMSGGDDWSQFYYALSPLPIYYRFLYLLFIVFALFAVANIVTGVFVESALQANLKDKDIVVHEELQAKKRYLQSMRELFEEMDESGEGTISLEEFEDKLKDDRVIAYFRNLKLDVTEAWTLFQLLDYDASDQVGIDEFLEGCYKLQGESSALDMKKMLFEMEHLQCKFHDFHSIISDLCHQLSGQLS